MKNYKNSDSYATLVFLKNQQLMVWSRYDTETSISSKVKLTKIIALQSMTSSVLAINILLRIYAKKRPLTRQLCQHWS